MRRVPMIIPVTDLRHDAAAAIKRAQDSQEPIVITQRGRAAAVMLGIKTYERIERERALLLDIVRGEHEIEIGESFDLDEVMAEADELLQDQ